MLSLAIIQNNGKLCFGFLVRKIHKRKLCLMKHFFWEKHDLWTSVSLYEMITISWCPHSIAFSFDDFGTYFCMYNFIDFFLPWKTEWNMKLFCKRLLWVVFHVSFYTEDERRILYIYIFICISVLTTERVFYFDFHVSLQ